MALTGLVRTRRAVWTLTQRRGKATAQAQAQAHTQALGGAASSSRSRSAPVAADNGASSSASDAAGEERSQRLLRRNTSIPGFSPSELIVKKRNGRRLSREEIDWFVQGFHRGDIEDYQMSALLMTIAIKGMSNQEASDLTLSMVRTGSTANLAGIRPDMPKIDKHSTGGVGDSTSLVLAPLMASLGVVVPILSGRTLGHTGGTLDKIDSIPGCRTTLCKEEFMRVLDQTGVAYGSPDATGFAPVDSSIYALRDVSGSVDSIALVASSVMSKKLAANPDALLLDVKRGRGAFFNNLNDTASLASMMCSIGEDAGIHTMALITCMDHVLGGSVGNWVEVQEAVRILAGETRVDVGADPRFETSPEALSDLRDLALSEAAVMLGLAGKAGSFREGFEMARDKLETGDALDKFAEIVAAQGGDPRVLYNLAAATPPLYTQTLYAEEDVVIQDVNARDIGNAATLLGAGRTYAGDAIDVYAGICIHAKVGEVVRRGDPVLTAMVRDPTVEPPSGNPDTDFLFLGGEREFRLRLNRGFDLACRGVVVAPNRPENHVQPAPLIEYLVDARGVQPFKNL